MSKQETCQGLLQCQTQHNHLHELQYACPSTLLRERARHCSPIVCLALCYTCEFLMNTACQSGASNNKSKFWASVLWFRRLFAIILHSIISVVSLIKSLSVPFISQLVSCIVDEKLYTIFQLHSISRGHISWSPGEPETDPLLPFYPSL